MARRYGIASKNGVATGTSLKTLIQLVAATNHAVAVTGMALGFHGVSNTAEPILVQLTRQTTAGTMSALTTIKKDNSVSDTLDTTAQHTATAEPTAGDVLMEFSVHPQTGFLKTFSREEELIIGAGGRLGLVVTAAADVNCDATLFFEE